MKKISHILISLIFLINISACAGYKPIFSSSNLEFKITDYSILGDKKLGNRIYSKLYNLSKSTENTPKEQNKFLNEFSLFNNQANRFNNNKISTNKKYKFSYINIDSRNRTKKTILEFGSIDNLPKDPFFFNKDNQLIVYHPNNGFNISGLNQLILLNIIGDNDTDKICNYPIDKIEYSDKNSGPIHIIKSFLNISNDTSDYYVIELPKITNNTTFIKNGRGGGLNVMIKVVKNKHDFNNSKSLNLVLINSIKI